MFNLSQLEENLSAQTEIMNMKLKIKKEQLANCLKSLDTWTKEYKVPRARFLTDQDEWIIEVEKVHVDGKSKLNALKNAAKIENEYLIFEVKELTGNGNINQYYLSGLKNGTYAVKVNIANPKNANIF